MRGILLYNESSPFQMNNIQIFSSQLLYSYRHISHDFHFA